MSLKPRLTFLTFVTLGQILLFISLLFIYCQCPIAKIWPLKQGIIIFIIVLDLKKTIGFIHIFCGLSTCSYLKQYFSEQDFNFFLIMFLFACFRCEKEEFLMS